MGSWRWPNAALDGVVVDLQPTIIEIAIERRPVVERVADRLRQWTLGWHLGKVRLEPRLQCAEKWRRSLLA